MTMLDDPDAEEWFGADDAGDQGAARVALFLVDHFGREAPLRAELKARDALDIGDLAAYRLFKVAEGIAEDRLFERTQVASR